MDDPKNTRGRALLAAWLAEDPARSQTKLADDLGITQPSVSGWLTGKSRPEDAMREAVEILTGVPRAAWRTEAERDAVAELRARFTPSPDPTDPSPYAKSPPAADDGGSPYAKKSTEAA